jgi:integrase
MVGQWWAGLAELGPTGRAQCQVLLKTILNSAVADGLLTQSPAAGLKGGSKPRPARGETTIATPEELTALTAALPDRWQVMVLLGCWTALRQGEARELRRGDISFWQDPDGQTRGLIKVRRAVSFVTGQGAVTGLPKTERSSRDVPIPPQIVPLLLAHLAAYVAPEPDALIISTPGGTHLPAATWQKTWRKARQAAGRPDLRFHDLRHTGLTYYATAGATARELMNLAGHATATMALHYQHIVSQRPQTLAAKVFQAAHQAHHPPANQPPE